jgi:RNA polymerase sigma-70 factor (ECF subfamily)
VIASALAMPSPGALHDAALAALARGAAADARRLADEAVALDAGAWHDPTWATIRDVRAWPDAWLVAAVREEPPDVPALDALVARHWAPLYARCRLLAPDGPAASDLAQESWLRLLRARRTLDPAGNVAAYLATVAANLWRDRHRAALRAGDLADARLAPLDAAPDPHAPGLALAEVLADPDARPVDEQVLLALDLDRALARLSPRARDVLVARHVDGESCADIGRRYGRTEQTASAWVRQAAAEMRRLLGEPAPGDAR